LRIGLDEFSLGQRFRSTGLGDYGFDRARNEGRLGETGADGVDRDSGLGEFERQRSREANETVLRRAISGDIGVADKARGRRDVDEPGTRAARFQVGENGARDEIGAIQVHSEHARPEAGICLLERRAWRFAGIVDKDRYRPQRGARPFDAG
jgi:hypothetical protein